MNFTHQKHHYRARCLQWDGQNTHDILVALNDRDTYASLHGTDHIMVRYDERIETLEKGWWIVHGENGQVKCYPDATFKVKYEAIIPAMFKKQAF